MRRNEPQKTTPRKRPRLDLNDPENDPGWIFSATVPRGGRWTGMSQPRMCIPGATYLVTRTVSNRRFLLKPSPVVNAAFLYCLAVAAHLFGILIHAVCVESTHYHLVVTDPRGELSSFMHWLNRSVARCLIEHYASTHPHEHLEGIWSKGHFGATLLVNHNAILKALVYTFTNPQKDGLVRDYRDWPGLHSCPADWLEPPRTVARTTLYFDGSKPENAEVEYKLSIPPAFTERDASSFVADVDALIHDAQEATCATMRVERRTFLGRIAVLATNPFDAPHSPRRKGGVNPRVAAGGDSDALSHAKKALQFFRRCYRDAWELFRIGTSVTFPAGTLQWRRLFSVPCEPLYTPWCLRMCD